MVENKQGIFPCKVFPKRHFSGLMTGSIKCRPHKIYRRKEQWGALLSVRYASTDPANMPPGYIPDIPLGPIDDIKTVLPELNALGEPTLQSIGLGGNNPSGLIQQLLEMVHVSLDVPWWASVVICK
ncbi:mitochondrial inner membrane protein OXA1L-like isoform X2 [Ruditapes philippinarum]|uniref:mitochondrial inner membrane protein OXA1L-like isoform X2 n=1 Tax=Ruditapes philippinarum TaxID=129788 RepID=UPI00295A69B4|nr:mitochondrial inner membrane protein OXA1L-like isoform X2 [Ruditapes philippinarum]